MVGWCVLWLGFALPWVSWLFGLSKNWKKNLWKADSILLESMGLSAEVKIICMHLQGWGDPNWCLQPDRVGIFCCQAWPHISQREQIKAIPSNAILYTEGLLIFFEPREGESEDMREIKPWNSCLPWRPQQNLPSRGRAGVALSPLLLTGTWSRVSARVCQFSCTQKVNPMG